jgi:septum formation protein
VSVPRLVLASASPRRRELLASLGLIFTVRAADVDETPLAGEAATATVLRLASVKADTVAAPDTVVLAADTLVVVDGDSLGKPADPGEARAMLRRIAGRRHEVHTGVVARATATGRHTSAVVTSRVTMAALSEEEIAWYVATGEPLDKAGAYAVQGIGAMFVDEVEGNYSNVVGLPLPAVRRVLAELGFDWREWRDHSNVPRNSSAATVK